MVCFCCYCAVRLRSVLFRLALSQPPLSAFAVVVVASRRPLLILCDQREVRTSWIQLVLDIMALLP